MQTIKNYSKPFHQLLAEQVHSVLNRKQNCEIKCTDYESGSGSLITVQSDARLLSAFANVNHVAVSQTVLRGIAFQNHGVYVKVLKSFAIQFLSSVRTGTECECVCITVQGLADNFCLVGTDHNELCEALIEFIGVTSRLRLASVTINGRDSGRKACHAKKDLAAIRISNVTLKSLADLEMMDPELAWKFTEKDRVVSKPDIESLKSAGVTPAVAFLVIAAWRSLSKRPEHTVEARRLYVQHLPRIFKSIAKSKDTAEVFAIIRRLLNKLSWYTRVVGNRFGNFDSSFRFNGRSLAEHIRNIQSAEDDSAWQLVEFCLTTRDAKKSSIPLRKVKQLSKLKRVSKSSPKISTTVNSLCQEFGFGGIEFGNSVSTSEMESHLRWIALSFHDLQTLCGAEVIHKLNVQGSLVISVGSRGAGTASATYDRQRKVINLTRMNGDGTLAHEYGHYVDNILSDDSRVYLSQRALKMKPSTSTQVAMHNLISGIVKAEMPMQYVGKPNAFPRYRVSWIMKPVMVRNKSNPQRAFDKLNVGMKPQPLANTIATFFERQISVNGTEIVPTAYADAAKNLSAYYCKPEEMFARAFEAWCEDKLGHSESCNEYLVFGTNSTNLSQCYPQGDERRLFFQLMTNLIETLNQAGTKMRTIAKNRKRIS